MATWVTPHNDLLLMDTHVARALQFQMHEIHRRHRQTAKNITTIIPCENIVNATIDKMWQTFCYCFVVCIAADDRN